jgi:hypothetical protein
VKRALNGKPEFLGRGLAVIPREAIWPVAGREPSNAPRNVLRLRVFISVELDSLTHQYLTSCSQRQFDHVKNEDLRTARTAKSSCQILSDMSDMSDIPVADMP